MAAPSEKPNLEKIVDGIQQRLSLIDHAHGYYTNGVVVDAGRDPTLIRQDKASEYNQKAALVSVRVGTCEKDRSHSAGGRVRWKQKIELWVMQTLTATQKTALITLPMIEARLRHDLERALGADSGLREAMRTLDTATPGVGYDRISCMNLGIERVMFGPPMRYPDTLYIAIATCEWDQYL